MRKLFLPLILISSFLALAFCFMIYFVSIAKGISLFEISDYVVIGIFVFLLFLVFIYLGIQLFTKFQIRKIYSKYPELEYKGVVDLNLMTLMKRVLKISKFKSAEIDTLKERENYRREFIGNVSHELKTPLFSIQGYVLTLIEGAKDDEEILEKYLDRVNKSVERLTFIINDLDAIAEIESNFKLNLSSVNLFALTNEVFDLLDLKAKKMGVKLVFDKHYTAPVKVKADLKRLEQVMINLIENGIKHAGGKQITVGFKQNKKKTSIFIRDQGEGIPKKDQKRIFERFYRLDKSRNRDTGGSGLGLAIVKHILEAHGSEITLESTEGKGSVFMFELKSV